MVPTTLQRFGKFFASRARLRKELQISNEKIDKLIEIKYADNETTT